MTPRQATALAIVAVIVAAYSTWHAVYFARIGEWDRVVTLALSIVFGLIAVHKALLVREGL